MSTLEIIATITGIIAVALQAKEKILAWPFAIVSVVILAYIFFFQKLYSDFGLHIIYIFLNIYGWVIWSNKREEAEVTKTVLMTENHKGMALVVTLIGTVVLGYIMATSTDADVPYFDAFTTCGSLVAQYLLAKKYLQNWLLWIMVDVVAIPVYVYKELYLVAFLFLVYLVICVYGYLLWKQGIKDVQIAAA
jgi:nicotinamide mononucleotide transporter